MVIKKLLDIVSSADYIHVPVMNAYHSLKDNVFLNTKDKHASLLEEGGNFFLSPARYLFNGKKVSHIVPQGTLKLKQEFDYAKDSQGLEILKTVLAIIALPISLIIGSALKGLAYLDPSVRKRHREISQEINSGAVQPKTEEYRKLGIPQLFSSDRVTGQGHPVPEPSAFQKTLKAAVCDISAVLEKEGIPSWPDCGTLLGIYRHSGELIPWDTDADMGCMALDHKNVMNALRALDPDKYLVQDWSCSRVPEMFIRVLIKENNSYIDIYHHVIESETTMRYKYSWTDSPWVPNVVKEREICQEKSINIKDVFPLKKAPLGDKEVFVPNDWEAFLKVKYGPNIDPCKVWNPATRQYDKVPGHPYWDNHEY